MNFIASLLLRDRGLLFEIKRERRRRVRVRPLNYSSKRKGIEGFFSLVDRWLVSTFLDRFM